MTPSADIGLAVLRSAAVGAAAMTAGSAVRRLLGAERGWRRTAAWALLLTPLLTPAALTGYAYANFSLSLIHYPAWNHVLYAALLWCKTMPVAAIVLYVSPGGLSPEAAHCRRMLAGPSGGPARAWRELLFEMQASARPCAAAGSVAFLLAFSDFELATLLGAPTWTVRLFDAHAGGLALGESLKSVLAPVAFQAAALGAIVVLLLGDRHAPTLPGEARAALSPALRAAAWVCAALAACAVALVPLALVTQSAAPAMGGWAGVLGTADALGDIRSSLIFAAATALCAWLAAGILVSARPAWVVAAALPGLFGALVLSLGVLALFQTPPLRAVYDTPLPLVVTLTLLLLPYALLLRRLLCIVRPGASLWAAELLRESPSAAVRRRGAALAAFYRAQGRFWVVAFVFGWAYFDLTASSILAPKLMTPVLTRLYNFMHYGQSAGLSALLCAAIAVPAALLGVAWAARRAVNGWRMG
jgi:hypothetical protein